MPLDPNSGLPLDPQTLQALQQQQIMQQVGNTGGTSRERANDLTAAQGLSNLFPSPQVQQARQLQTAVQGATLQQNDGESDLDFSIRQLHSQRDAVAHFDPQAAAQMNTQLLKLGQMKFEQNRLTAADQRQQAEFEEGEPGRQAAATQAKATGSLAYLAKQDPNSEFGYSAKSYDLSNQEDLQKFMEDRQRDPSLQVMSAKEAAAQFLKTDVASMRVNQALIKAQTDANALTPEGLNLLAGTYSIDPSAMARQPPSVRAQVLNRLANVGITPTDMAAARAQLRFLNSDASTVGRRAGNIDILQNELGGMGQQVLQTLGGVTRTSWTGLNSIIAAGKTALSDPGEKAYAGAVQSFVNTYARVISGGTGTSTDSAREEAWALLRKNDGPEAVKAAVQQLATRELGVVRQASSTAVEALAHPEKYGAILKIQQKLGFQALDSDDSRFTVPNGQAAPTLPPSQTQGQGGLPQGWSVTVR